jgi:class 3 adenylate cyclase/tetratricopeptide (TPR) repeat protein/TolB-like protein
MAEEVPPSSAQHLEIAHVLFVDIVGYSRLAIDQQEQVLRHLQDIVRTLPGFTRAQAEDQLVRLPTGDGMALVFFGDPEGPVRCALELAHVLTSHAEIPLRMGIHSGPVYRVDDINANRNVAGGGINIAQRVMDCGDAGHILVSNAVAEVLGQHSVWRDAFKDLGEAEVKHGVRVHVFNLCAEGVGNPKRPQKLRRATMRKTAQWSSVAIVLGLVVAGVLSWRYLGRSVGIGGEKQRRSIAVLGFRNLGHPEDQWMSMTLSETLTTELAAGEQLRTVPGENVARMESKMKLPETDSLGEETLSRIRQTLNTDLVVLGSYFNLGGQVRVDLRLQDTRAGETIASVSDSAPELQMMDLVSRLGAKLRSKCGAGEITPSQAAEARASQPVNLESARLYAEGLAKLREYDAQAGRDLLQKAVAADPKNALVRSALAEAWSDLGYDAKAQEESAKAFDLAGALSREERLVIEGRYRSYASTWDQAIKSYNTLFSFFPDNLEYGLSLAGAQISGSKGQDALGTVASLRKLTEPSRNDPRIDLVESDAASALSDFRQAQTVAEKATEKAQGLGSRFLAAQGLRQQCWAFRNLGDFAKAKAAGEKAGDDFKADGNLRVEAESLSCVANVLVDQGDVGPATVMFEKALSLAQQAGAQKDIAGSLINLGNALADTDLPRSTQSYEKALGIASAVGDKPDALLAQNGIAGNLMIQGEFEKAQKTLQEALQTAREIGDRAGEAEELINLAAVSLELGNLDEAQKEVETGVAASRSLGLRKDTVLGLIVGGDILVARDDISGAEKMYQKSLENATQMSDKGSMANSGMALAALTLEQGQAGRAETEAQRLAGEFRSIRDAGQETVAHDVAAQALMAQNKLGPAADEIKQGQRQAQAAQDQIAMIHLAITAARLRSNTGNAKDALQDLGSILRRTQAMKLRKLEFDGQLARAEALGAAGRAAEALANLQTLTEQARQSGFLLVARKAQEASRTVR